MYSLYRVVRGPDMLQAKDEIPVNKSPGARSTGIGAAQKYDAAQIDKLEGLAAVRKRAGLFIGGPDERGFHHLVFQVLNKSIDDHLPRFSTQIPLPLLLPAPF